MKVSQSNNPPCPGSLSALQPPMLIATGMLTVDFISTEQVKVSEDPDSMGLGESE